MAQRIQLRRGTAAEWTAANPVLALGEPGHERDTGKLKLGDGVTAWAALPYASAGPQGPAGVADDTSVADLVTTPGTETATALSATYVGKEASLVNVKDFGAKGDGVTDDRAAIQAAINYLRADGRTGGIAYFPMGEYRVSNTIKLPTGVTIRGAQGGFWVYASIGRSRIFMDPTVAAPTIQNASANTTYDANITIEKLYIEGPASAVGHAIHIKGQTRASERVLIRDCFITNFGGGQGIRLELTQTSEIRSCYISNIYAHAVVLYNAFDNLLEGNQIDCYKQSTDTVHGDGIRFENASDNNILTNNFIFLCDYGIRMLSAHGNTVNNNRINTCNFGLQMLSLTLGNVERNQIIGNQFYDHGYKGAGVTGIWVDGYTRWNTIIGNVSGDARAGGRTQQYGMRLLGNAVGNVVTGNNFANNINAGLLNSATGANNVFGNTDGTFSGFNLADGQDVRIDATTGSRIGQSTSKLAFYGATPIVKPTGIPAAATDLASAIALANDMRAKWISLGLST